MKRFRPYRTDEATREAYAEVRISNSDFIYPYFVVDGSRRIEPIASLKGISRLSPDEIVLDLADTLALGIDKILLFGVVDDTEKDDRGSAAYDPESVVCRAIRLIKQHYPNVVVFTDVCLCEYTSHGHCGLLLGQTVDNDSTLPLLAKMALVHAQAGADFVAPSAMMDGQIEAIRQVLDQHGLKTRILAYSAKYASSFYGPFRDAAGSAPSFGDRKSYHMDYRTRYQGLDEITADLDEGADWVMVKPALSYLDVLRQASDKYPNTPLVGYQVSGEYAMLKAAAQAGVLNEEAAFTETLTAIKRAGAHYIISYYAKEFIRKGL